MTLPNAGRKWPTIDIVALYSRADTAGWNQFLTSTLRTGDVHTLKKTLYGIQAGMTDAAKAGLADKKLQLWFIRIQRSIEDTAKKIFRQMYPNPLDNPLQAANAEWEAFRDAKKKRDQEFERFLRESSF